MFANDGRLNVCRKKGVNNTIVRDYVLPDYTHIKRGHVRAPGEASTGTEQVTDFTVLMVVDHIGHLRF